MGNYIRFDWAMKRLLRDKANFDIIEGLITTLLNDKIKIVRILESESNQETEYDKQNRVDILAEDSKGSLFLVEVQNNTEFAYFQRMLFGTSKLVTEYMRRGEGYENVRKIYSINIVYFNLGHGSDYVYRGITEFRGIHNNETLNLTPFQQAKFDVSETYQLFPEYFILRVNGFNDVAKTPLEEWIYFLKTGELPERLTAPGLKAVKDRMAIDSMSNSERRSYDKYIEDLKILESNVYTERAEGRMEGRAEGRIEGLAEGRAEGRAEGLAEGRAEMVRAMRQHGLTDEAIAEMTALPIDVVKSIG